MGRSGVELNVEHDALPDYSHDLERYLIRLASAARERRKQIINAISTPQGILERQKVHCEMHTVQLAPWHLKIPRMLRAGGNRHGVELVHEAKRRDV